MVTKSTQFSEIRNPTRFYDHRRPKKCCQFSQSCQKMTRFCKLSVTICIPTKNGNTEYRVPSIVIAAVLIMMYMVLGTWIIPLAIIIIGRWMMLFDGNEIHDLGGSINTVGIAIACCMMLNRLTNNYSNNY